MEDRERIAQIQNKNKLFKKIEKKYKELVEQEPI